MTTHHIHCLIASEVHNNHTLYSGSLTCGDRVYRLYEHSTEYFSQDEALDRLAFDIHYLGDFLGHDFHDFHLRLDETTSQKLQEFYSPYNHHSDLASGDKTQHQTPDDFKIRVITMTESSGNVYYIGNLLPKIHQIKAFGHAITFSCTQTKHLSVENCINHLAKDVFKMATFLGHHIADINYNIPDDIKTQLIETLNKEGSLTT